MMEIDQVKKSVPLLLIIGILIVCVGFFIVSCGSGISPQMKIEAFNSGPYAVDFSDCPAPTGNPCKVIIDSKSFKTMGSNELTAEAWVKINASFASGAIFGRLDTSGIMLYVKSGTPKAVVRRVVGLPPSTSTIDHLVGGASSLLPNSWTHLAAVLSFPSSSTSTLSLYVDGQLKGTAGIAIAKTQFTEPTGDFMTAGAFETIFAVDGIPLTASLDGVVDEARLWGVARTQSEIQDCMGEELGLNSGACGRITDDLIGYWRFNNGSGDNVAELTGLGGAFKEYNDPSSSNIPPVEHWNSGWIDGAPIVAKD